jgi:hypothetical protein
MDALWHHDLAALIPASPVQYQHDAPIRASAYCLRKMRESNAEDLAISRRQQEPLARSCFWMDEPIHVQPLIALLHANNWTMPSTRPDAPDDRLEADAMLIHRPQLHLCIRISVLDLLDLRLPACV